MSARRRRLTRAVCLACASLVLTSLALTSSGCAKAPAECAAPFSERQKQLDAKAAFAIEARKAADQAVERALAAVRTQDDRFAPMRNYDEAAKLCAAADQALAAAAAAVVKAEATAARVEKRDAEASKALGSLDARLVLARGLADSGVVDADATAALRKLVQTGTDAKRALDRARAEQRASGFGLEPAAFDAAADGALGVIDEVRKSTLAIAEQVAARCRLKLTGEELGEASLRAHADWVVLDVPGAEARRIVVLKLDRDKKSCVTVYDRAASPTAIEDLEGELFTWSIPGTIPVKILVSFGKKSAWFLEGARFVRHAHEKAAGFSGACAGAVTCAKPRATPKTLEATCDCSPPAGHRLLPSELTKTGRYAWDGARVIAEP